MNMFSVYPVMKCAPKDFRLSIGGNRETVIGCTFTATREHEIDAAITALIAVRGLLRGNVNPLPRDQSVVLAQTTPQLAGLLRP
jgi:hypothetical protein